MQQFQVLVAVLCIFLHKINAKNIQFYGDISIEKYCQQNCHIFAASKVKLIIISNLNITSQQIKVKNREPSKLISQLNAFKCEHLHFLNVTSSQLKTKLSQFKNGQLQVIFDLPNVKFNQATFNQTLTILSHLYFPCSNCFPFIISLNSLQNIHKWTLSSEPYFNKYFQNIFIANNNAKLNSIHLNPILDGCLFYKGIYLPKTKSDFIRLQTSPLNCNLKQKQFNVSVNLNFPYCSFTKAVNGRIEPEYSIDLELLKEMKEKFNFTVNLIDANNIWGSVINGTWNGLVGDIAKGNSEFGICEIGITKERLQVIDSTTYTYFDQIVFISQSPLNKKRNLLFSSAISIELQASIGASFILMFIFINLFNVIYGNVFNYKETYFKEPIILQLVGVFLKEVIDGIFKEPFTSLRILYTVWMFACFILSNIYSSIFYSRITVPEFGLPIDSMEDFLTAVTTDSHQVITKSEASIENAILKAQPNDGVYYSIQQHILRVKPPMIDQLTEVIPRLEANPRVIVLMVRNSLLVKRALYSTVPLHIGSDPLESLAIGWAIRKRSPLTGPFDRIIVRYREQGLMDYLLRTSVRKMASQMARSHPKKRLQAHSLQGNALRSAKTSADFKTITADDLQTVFVLLAVGQALAVVVCLLQIVYWLFFHSKNT